MDFSHSSLNIILLSGQENENEQNGRQSSIFFGTWSKVMTGLGAPPPKPPPPNRNDNYSYGPSQAPANDLEEEKGGRKSNFLRKK